MKDLILTQLTITELRDLIREETSKVLEGKIGQPNSSKKFFTTEEACAYMQISKSHIYKLTSKGQIAHSKRGKKIYLEKTVLD